jgi:hypothetical protein
MLSCVGEFNGIRLTGVLMDETKYASDTLKLICGDGHYRDSGLAEAADDWRRVWHSSSIISWRTLSENVPNFEV